MYTKIIINDFLPLILSLYISEFLILVVSLIFLLRHLISRYKKGYISVFMGSIGFLFLHLAFSTLTAYIVNISESYTFSDNFLLLVWLILILSHIGIVVSIAIITFFFITKRFDIFITKIQKEELLKEDVNNAYERVQ